MVSDIRRPCSHAVGKSAGIAGKERPERLLEIGKVARKRGQEAVGGLPRGLRLRLSTLRSPRFVDETPQRL